MSTARVRSRLSRPSAIAVLLAVLAAFVYGFLTRQLLKLIPTVVFLYLFYRLVLAVERIAADS
ncbi:hypothetical protein [Salinilacihabitans rarus]|uniref:hypothetical protein n=1 Tax=Salinilacihabitans rarus TaxID=2961596 RepID=UPI0020C8B4E8|nr:hypothetical protein [Salinilacihabitans rarus]